MEFSIDGVGGYPPSVKIIHYTKKKKKVRPLQTVLNGMKHEKKNKWWDSRAILLLFKMLRITHT